MFAGSRIKCRGLPVILHQIFGIPPWRLDPTSFLVLKKRGKAVLEAIRERVENKPAGIPMPLCCGCIKNVLCSSSHPFLKCYQSTGKYSHFSYNTFYILHGIHTHVPLRWLVKRVSQSYRRKIYQQLSPMIAK